FDFASDEADHRPLAAVLELCNEARMHTILSEHPYRKVGVAELNAEYHS
ncbi:MAG: hypothetical protein UW91_C0024G0013, partial [Parcubacteria group bacterium GW2011_GWF2_45_11]